MARAAAGRVRHGFIQALAGRAPASEWRWRSPQERRSAYVALGVATLALCVLSASTMHGVASMHGPTPPHTSQLSPTLGQQLLALAVVLPLPLAARYPMLAWRVGWLGLLLSPLLPAAWWGGWPWGPPQILALLGAFCLAAAGAVVDVGTDPHPVVAVAPRGHPAPERPGQRHDRVHRRGGRGGQRRLPAALPAGTGGPDRARRGRAGTAGRAGGTHPDRAGTARCRRPPHVADRGPGGDRAVSPERHALLGPRRVQLAERDGARGAGRDAAAARRAAPRTARRPCAAAPAIGPARARRCRAARRGVGRAVGVPL